MPKRIFSTEGPSDFACSAFSARMSTSCQATCEHCGRINFADPSEDGCGDWEDGEVERLLEQEKAGEAFRHTACNGVSICEAAGKTFLVGCPCNFLTVYEQTIWNDRNAIIEYFKAKKRHIDAGNKAIESL